MADEVDKIIKEFKPVHHGFIPDLIEDNHYVLGGLASMPLEILQPTGDWSEFIPQVEVQRNEFFETSNCTAYGTLNALEFLFKRLFGETKNWSERYVGISAGTRPPGNSPHKVIQTIRNESGLLDESVLPFKNINTLEEYYSPDPIPWLMKVNGSNFLDKYEIGHEWLWSGNQCFSKPNIIKEALKSSPLGASVYAWVEKNGLYVKPVGADDNHWCVIYAYKENEYWLIYDSYDKSVKKLEWDYDFGQIKRYSIKKVDSRSFWDLIKLYFINLFK